MGYTYVWEHSGGGRHIDADWSPNFEDLYSPELDFRILVCACVEVMTTLHGSTPSLFEACRGLRTAGGAISLFRSSCFLRIGPLLFIWLYLRGVEGRLVRYSERQSMDQQVVTVDQFTAAMASIQEALASLRQEIGGQQGRPPVARDDAQYDPTVPPPPPPSQSAPQAMPFTLHSQTGVAPPPITVPTPTSKDPHARMDRLEQGLRQMPDIERYMVVGCLYTYLRLYSTVMRAHGTRDDLAQEFCDRKIAEIVDRPLQRDDSVLMVIRGLIRGLGGKFRPNWSEPYFIRDLTPEGAAWLMDLDGNLLSEPTNVDQLKRVIFIEYVRYWSSYVSSLRSHVIVLLRSYLSRPISGSILLHHHYTYHYQLILLHLSPYRYHIHVFEPSFLSFLSPYHLGLRYVPCLKTTLRPWDQMSSSAASTWTGLIQLCSDYQDRHIPFHLEVYGSSQICTIIIAYWMLTETWTWSLPYGAPEIHPASSALLDAWMPSCLSIRESCTLIPTYEIHIDTMFPPWSLSGVTQLGLHLATLRCHHAFLPRDAPLIYGSGLVVHVDDLDCAFDDGCSELICPLVLVMICEMTVYTRHLLSRDHSALRAYPFWDDAFILRHSHLADFDIETPLLVYDRCSRWIVELLAP
ncbi:hypothetical protein CK203_026746 [Vitis vinifera]|uniref:Uncharacterized protein n=1 Tax=Vitis vinifera TaxID=29760 RepID=A0A438INZ1_VITVI|nr:hypothetical protein CK203_026746 [Vitis vinifera]